MLFQKRIDRAFKFLKEKNNVEESDNKDKPDYIEEYNPPMEIKDYIALVISAFLVFSPIFIVLILILLWAFKGII